MKIPRKIHLITISILCFSIISLNLIYITAKNSNITFFVATTGSDSNPGTENKPFATLEATRNAIRKLKDKNQLKPGPITVYLRSGTYYRTKSFSLESIDSGDIKSPIIYKAYKNEKVILTGGINLDKNKFIKVTNTNILSRIIDESARSHILKYDLHSDGIDCGAFTRTGLFSSLLS